MLITKVENKYGQILNLSESPDYDVIEVTGLTPASATINTSKIAGVDGSKFNSSSLDDRNVVLTIVPRGDIEKARIELYKYLKSKQYVKLYLKNGTRDVWIEGYVETIEGSLFSQLQQIQISIICPDPYFKDIDEALYNFSNTESLFEFEFSLDNEGEPVSETVNYDEFNILNLSDDEAGVVINLRAMSGTVLEPTIHNLTTGDKFTIRVEMAEGDRVVLNTRKGNKSLTLYHNGVESNIINRMGKNSKWFSLAVGDNLFSYECVYGAENLHVDIALQPIYEGV